MDAVQPHIVKAVDAFPVKFLYFAQKGYFPHAWQLLFHGASSSEGTLLSKRHLAAGRRGGKTH